MKTHLLAILLGIMSQPLFLIDHDDVVHLELGNS